MNIVMLEIESPACRSGSYVKEGPNRLVMGAILAAQSCQERTSVGQRSGF